jgi:hypothetical protein
MQPKSAFLTGNCDFFRHEVPAETHNLLDTLCSLSGSDFLWKSLRRPENPPLVGFIRFLDVRLLDYRLYTSYIPIIPANIRRVFGIEAPAELAAAMCTCGFNQYVVICSLPAHQAFKSLHKVILDRAAGTSIAELNPVLKLEGLILLHVVVLEINWCVQARLVWVIKQ